MTPEFELLLEHTRQEQAFIDQAKRELAADPDYQAASSAVEFLLRVLKRAQELKEQSKRSKILAFRLEK